MGYGDPGTSAFSYQTLVSKDIPAGVSASGSYNSVTKMYTPIGANLPLFRAKMARAVNNDANCEISWLGPSTVAGIPGNSRTNSAMNYWLVA
jgi:hypothetical protein